MADFGGDIEGKGIHNYKLQNSPQNEGLTNVCRSAITEIWDFTTFSAILASFSLKMVVLGVTLKSRVFIITNCNRNVAILVKMRG